MLSVDYVLGLVWLWRLATLGGYFDTKQQEMEQQHVVFGMLYKGRTVFIA